jgi:hypothetical protein
MSIERDLLSKGLTYYFLSDNGNCLRTSTYSIGPLDLGILVLSCVISGPPISAAARYPHRVQSRERGGYHSSMRVKGTARCIRAGCKKRMSSMSVRQTDSPYLGSDHAAVSIAL